MIEHFRDIVAKKIGGKAKAMLVCGSRLHAKKYYEESLEVTSRAKDIKRDQNISFSGKVVDDNTPDGITDLKWRWLYEKELPAVFEKDEYKILIVCW